MQWKCKDGRVIDIEDMETSHLQNKVQPVYQLLPPVWTLCRPHSDGLAL